MEIFYADRSSVERYRNEIRRILWECDEEFYPPLSQRSSSSQKDLKTVTAAGDGPELYFREMIGQEFILAAEGEKLFGFMTFKKDYICDALRDFGTSLYITTVCVEKQSRNHGILGELYTCMENCAEEFFAAMPVSTRTWSSNEAQIHSLLKRGYREVALLKDDRGPGIDTIYFGKA